ncbi:hypothetical protein BCEP4_2300002 [Burkholderia cepacia]|nr:hypothetical protein BCEP4_2300002 [Burkholderia cepacia]
MRLGPLKLFLGHFQLPKGISQVAPRANNKTLTFYCWCPWAGSNCRPLPYQGSALPLSHMGALRFNFAVWSG